MEFSLVAVIAGEEILWLVKSDQDSQPVLVFEDSGAFCWIVLQLAELAFAGLEARLNQLRLAAELFDLFEYSLPLCR